MADNGITPTYVTVAKLNDTQTPPRQGGPPHTRGSLTPPAGSSEPDSAKERNLPNVTVPPHAHGRVHLTQEACTLHTVLAATHWRVSLTYLLHAGNGTAPAPQILIVDQRFDPT